MATITLSNPSRHGSLQATFTEGWEQTYTAFGDGTNDVISFDVSYGTEVTITAEAYDGYTFDYIYDETKSINRNSGYSFTTTNEDRDFSVEFYKESSGGGSSGDDSGSDEEYDYNFTVANITSTSFRIRVRNVTEDDEVTFWVLNKKTMSLVIETTTPTRTSLNSQVLDVTGLSPNTEYAIDVFVNGGDWLGEQYVTTEKSSKTRPQDWSWQNPIASESVIQLSADEWSAFASRINEFRVYKDLSEHTFTNVNNTTPTLISRNIVNEAITAISGITGHDTTCLPSVISNNEERQITASFFINLADALKTIN